MKVRFIAPAFAAGLALAATAVMANQPDAAPDPGTARSSVTGITTTSTDPEIRCSVLETQFDHTIANHQHALKAGVAKMLHKDGVRLCASGQTAKGIEKLEQALIDIGVTPYRPRG